MSCKLWIRREQSWWLLNVGFCTYSLEDAACLFGHSFLSPIQFAQLQGYCTRILFPPLLFSINSSIGAAKSLQACTVLYSQHSATIHTIIRHYLPIHRNNKTVYNTSTYTDYYSYIISNSAKWPPLSQTTKPSPSPPPPMASPTATLLILTLTLTLNLAASASSSP